MSVNKIWFSEINFSSGKTEKIVFATEDEAKDTFNKVRYEQHDKLVYVENGGKPSLINLRNIEQISEPQEFQPEVEY